MNITLHSIDMPLGGFQGFATIEIGGEAKQVTFDADTISALIATANENGGLTPQFNPSTQVTRFLFPADEFTIDVANELIALKEENDRLKDLYIGLSEENKVYTKGILKAVKPQTFMEPEQMLKTAHGYRKGYENIKQQLAEAGYKNVKGALQAIVELSNKLIEAQAHTAEAQKDAAYWQKQRDDISQTKEKFEKENVYAIGELEKMRTAFTEQRNDLTNLMNAITGTSFPEKTQALIKEVSVKYFGYDLQNNLPV